MRLVFRPLKFNFGKYEAKDYILSLFFIFFLIFPKGGLKVQGLPITWGLLLLFGFFFFSLFNRHLKLYRSYLLIFISFAPFLLLASFTILLFGYEELAYVFSYVVHFYFILPFFLLILPSYLETTDLEKIKFWIREGVFFVGIYGLFLFIYKWKTGIFFQIPFLTVNYHDSSMLEMTKCIDRGGIFKLISTYNNGNLYGVCILMILPIYELLEKNLFKKILVKSSLVFTLSRTIWMGLLAYELISLFSSKKNALIKIVFFCQKLGLLFLVFVLLNQIYPLSLDFIFDRFFGNRIGQFKVLENWHWLPSGRFEQIFEIIYLGLLKSFGAFGLILFCICFFVIPIALYLNSRYLQKNKDPMKEKAAIGMILYAFIAGADGALLLMPILIFYFFLIFLSLAPKKKQSYE